MFLNSARFFQYNLLPSAFCASRAFCGNRGGPRWGHLFYLTSPSANQPAARSGGKAGGQVTLS